MEFKELISQKCSAGIANFWKAVEILSNSPHLINRRIMSSSQICLLSSNNVNRGEIIEWFKDIERYNIDFESNNSAILNSLEILNADGNIYLEGDNSLSHVLHHDSNRKSIYIKFAKLMPRHLKVFSQTLEISLIDFRSNSVVYICKSANKGDTKSLGFDFMYQIKFENDNLYLYVESSNSQINNGSLDYLKGHFFSKLMKWIENDAPKNNFISGSLKLVSPEKYNSLYHEMKLKYGSKIVEIWPENTDPAKFVYEDVAIATYLIALWEGEKEKLNLKHKQSFVDLGCGNGLLVHILNSEGYPGYGIDLRKRKIWDLYPNSTNLKVQTIIPSSKTLFPQTDWLIGNHSDELTPWIPVIAARSSYNCRFFLLPCCAYEFNGKKYQRVSSSVSQYNDYIQYVQNVSTTCGFKTDIDKLRIPSTKRICLIGTDRHYNESESNLYDFKIQEIIKARDNGNESNDAWSSKFKPREITEKVRNCTKIDIDLKTKILDIVISLLFRKVRAIVIDDVVNKTWNAGCDVELSEIAEAIDSTMLKELKNECGGLQTLLKNNGDIFKVEFGKVRFRIPGKDKVGQNKKSNNSKTRKIKDCWFYKNHPDGCPLNDNECDFKHSGENSFIKK